jgi:glycerol-3-phosphate dehydrogenase
LLEAHDFAKATSSRSTKLVHGGVRYLERGEVGLVREALHERGLLLANAPHLVHSRAFLVPAYRWWDRPYYGLGLKAYDWLAGRLGLGPSRMVGREEALRLVPTLEPARLRGGVVYLDGQFDDARLAIALMRTAIDLGAVTLNYAPAVGLIHEGGRVVGVEARDEETGGSLVVRARVVVNAAGVFADEIRRMDGPTPRPLVRPSQGAHVVLDRSFLPGETAVLVPKTDDGRVLFAIPWLGRVLLGTTDTPVASAALEPRPLAEEVAYLRDYAARYLARDPGPSDILSAFAGLRPLVDAKGSSKGTARLSREHLITVSDAGLVTIVGGKWTTYRRMASDVIGHAAEVGGLARRPCATEGLRLHGYAPDAASDSLAAYGSDAPALRRLMAERPGLSEPIHPALPYPAAEVVWAARNELARTVEDVLARRMRALFLDARSSHEAAPVVAGLLADELGRDGAWREAQVREFRGLAEGYLPV